MVNPFDGIVNAAIKSTYKNAMSALITDLALTCRLVFSSTNFTRCPNCYYDSINHKSSNRYFPGGTIPFNTGQVCPMCHGVGKVISESTESINLAVVWDYKDFINLPTAVSLPEGYVQTISEYSTLPKIRRAKELIVDVDIENSVRHKFRRNGEPTPAGLGADDFIITLWKRS